MKLTILLGITIGLDFLLLIIFKLYSVKPENNFSFVFKQFCNYFSHNDENCKIVKSKIIYIL